jgi:subtilisin family serine protease
VALINVPAVHDLGNYAQGVIIGVFDNGFRLPTHEALLPCSVLATFDFVDNKVSVIPNNSSSDFGDHGIHTWSTLGGYRPGVLIGPAFGATFILARTENDSSETPVEEDYWVRAIEWADSLGIQVASTSLGYLSYNAPYTSWTWEDMDGRTTAISRAASMAVRKGIVVVNSAGNNGDNPTRNTLNAPADADSVLAVGAVDPNGARLGFSSVGPSTSSPPHIKPDIMAQGSSVFRASSVDPASYGISQGTSFSCPLAAGVAALLLKAHPTATPMQIAAALKATASNSTTPNNKIGWGIIDALAALRYLDTALGLDPGTIPATLTLRQNFPNPFNPRTTIEYDVPAAGTVSLNIYDAVGRKISTLIDRAQAPGTYRIDWDGTDSGGMTVASGVYVYRLEVRGTDGSIARQSRAMVLTR